MNDSCNTKNRIEVEISISSKLGLDTVALDMERILLEMIYASHNFIITQLHLTFDDDDAIVLYHEGVPRIQNTLDFDNFPEDMTQFCSSIAHAYPELEISGQFAVERNDKSQENAYVYLKSEIGSQTCYARRLSEETEPGIVFEVPKKSNHSTIDIYGVKPNANDS